MSSRPAQINGSEEIASNAAKALRLTEPLLFPSGIMSLIESLDWASPPDFPVLDRARKTKDLLREIARRIAAQACYQRVWYHTC